MNDDIISLIEQGKTAEAASLLKARLQATGEAEKGKLLLAYTQLCMQAANEANRQYSKDLAAIISALKSIDKAEKSLGKAQQ